MADGAQSSFLRALALSTVAGLASYLWVRYEVPPSFWGPGFIFPLILGYVHIGPSWIRILIYTGISLGVWWTAVQIAVSSNEHWAGVFGALLMSLAAGTLARFRPSPASLGFPLLASLAATGLASQLPHASDSPAVIMLWQIAVGTAILAGRTTASFARTSMPPPPPPDHPAAT